MPPVQVAAHHIVLCDLHVVLGQDASRAALEAKQGAAWVPLGKVVQDTRKHIVPTCTAAALALKPPHLLMLSLMSQAANSSTSICLPGGCNSAALVGSDMCDAYVRSKGGLFQARVALAMQTTFTK